MKEKVVGKKEEKEKKDRESGKTNSNSDRQGKSRQV